MLLASEAVVCHEVYPFLQIAPPNESVGWLKASGAPSFLDLTETPVRYPTVAQSYDDPVLLLHRPSSYLSKMGQMLGWTNPRPGMWI